MIATIGRWLAVFGLLLGLAGGLRAAEAPADSTLSGLWQGCDEACAVFDVGGAYEFAERAAQLDPEGLESLWRLVRSQVDRGETAQDEGREGEAEEWFGRALGSSRLLVERHPQSTRAHYYRALALGRRALFAGGREKVELSREIEREAARAIELDADNGRAHGLLGRYHREMAHLGWVMRTLAETLFGDLPEGGDELSYEHLKRAAELEPGWIFAWSELGETCEALGRDDEARQCYERALALPDGDHRDGRLKAEVRERLDDL